VKKKSLFQRQYNCVCEIEYRDERRNPVMNFAHSASRGLHLILGILMKWLIDLLIFCVICHPYPKRYSKVMTCHRVCNYSAVSKVWLRIKRSLQNAAGNINTPQELFTAIQDIWMNFTVDYIQNLYTSIPRSYTFVNSLEIKNGKQLMKRNTRIIVLKLKIKMSRCNYVA
jgi:hypothetical protein